MDQQSDKMTMTSGIITNRNAKPNSRMETLEDKGI